MQLNRWFRAGTAGTGSGAGSGASSGAGCDNLPRLSERLVTQSCVTRLAGGTVSCMNELTDANRPVTARRRLTLRDGSIVDVRPLERRDRAGLAAAVGRLSEYSRYLRFAATKPRLTERELDRLVDVDHHGHEALLAVDPVTRRGVAVVRYAQVPGETGVVEIAATVVDAWQGRGLGGAMLALLIERARDEGHSVLRASVLATNDRSIAMLRRAGFRPRSGGGVLREYERPLASQRGDPGLRERGLRVAGVRD
jgi:RimJ/RimL family protein N-acetyltransferase